MLFKTALLTAVSLVFASQAMGAAVNQERASDGIQIATDPGEIKLTSPGDPSCTVTGLCYLEAPPALFFLEQRQTNAPVFPSPVAACNCPNNCSHKQGSSCKFYTGPSDTSPIANGREFPFFRGQVLKRVTDDLQCFRLQQHRRPSGLHS
ncbi:hypothetical protein DL546_002660 [Coniochaeta pulveracea]|uniref:Uncharacterized protein n=1 Tax=Coniochaeta pulveracea TaxID=177199 RepID=A0A420Y1T6_9PEZI|nr:hypothetical protein DL546_002660 [Coniochaeta pulveracea]